MLNKELFGFCHEFYFVEKVIEVVVSISDSEKRVRIEALKKDDGYSAAAYLQENINERLMWISYPQFPSTRGETADLVLMEALGFLKERCSN